MVNVERELRRFRAAFFVTPGFANWVRTKAHELIRSRSSFRIVLVWGRRRFHVGNVPEDEPYFAIELADGSLERSPWVER